jgi:hypothetical protein
MKQVIITEDSREVKANINRIDRIITITELLDSEPMTITLTFGEYYQLYCLMCERFRKVVS